MIPARKPPQCPQFTCDRRSSYTNGLLIDTSTARMLPSPPCRVQARLSQLLRFHSHTHSCCTGEHGRTLDSCPDIHVLARPHLTFCHAVFGNDFQIVDPAITNSVGKLLLLAPQHFLGQVRMVGRIECLPPGTATNESIMSYG